MSKEAHAAHFSKRQSADLNPGCSTGIFYKLPKQGDNIDTSKPIDIQWDTSLNCIPSQGVDIYLYAQYSNRPILHAWGAVSNTGRFQTSLEGAWWNSTVTPIQLQLRFVESGTPIFLSPVPPGPVFTSTFNATDFGLRNPTGSSTPNTSSNASGGGIFQVIGNAYKNTGLPKGNIVAAIVIPLLAVAIGITVFVKFQRAKEAKRRKRWSEAIDRRMSAISSEWKGLPPNAQSEAIRQSIAIMRNSRASVARMSQLCGEEGRLSNTFAVGDAGAAGIGARKVTGVGPRNLSLSSAQMSQRKSTVSFAADTRFSNSATNVPEMPKAVPRPSTEKTRPSTETQRGRASRAFHTAINPTSSDDLDALMSPTQRGSPVMIGDSHIKKLALGETNDVPACDAVKQHRKSNDDGNFLILAHSPLDSSQAPIASPPATLLTPTSASPFTNATPYSPSYANVPVVHAPSQNNPFAGFTRGPSNMMSPDAMLRAYASRDGTSSAPGTPMTVAHTTPSPQSAKARYYPAFDAPAQPQPVHDMDLLPGLPPTTGGRTLYTPGQGRVSVESRYSAGGNDEAYGGYGKAT